MTIAETGANTRGDKNPSPIVLDAGVAKRRPPRGSDHPDADLIQDCVKLQAALRGAEAAFEIDATCDCDFAQDIDRRAEKRASKRLKRITKYMPSTLDGLRAKSAITRVLVDISWPGKRKFLRSLVDDIERFHLAAEGTHQAIAP